MNKIETVHLGENRCTTGSGKTRMDEAIEPIFVLWFVTKEKKNQCSIGQSNRYWATLMM